jgi:hypothetical protein
MITHKTKWLLVGLVCLALWPAQRMLNVEVTWQRGTPTCVHPRFRYP